MKIGVAYHPEHWPEERWPEDARLMRRTGVEVVRVGQFVWSRLEPRRMHYDMEWLQRALDALSAEGLKIILCTPTAAPPSWLFERHPDMIPEDAEGRPWHAGGRRHVCLNNRPYRRYALRIVRLLARTFGQRQDILAWQIDNEPQCSVDGLCYCDDCAQAFREWLKGRYGAIGRLNKQWGTAFWGQEFADWHYIPPPRRTPGGAHPSLALDYRRFASATVREFVREQRGMIEEYVGSENTIITTNCAGLDSEQLDQYALSSVVDVAAYDNHPARAETPDEAALELDLCRSAKAAPFWVLEQQTGAGAAEPRPRPGQLRLWSYQAAARGAELISYFRWRTCRAGQEMRRYGMLDADGSQKRRFEELKETIAELKKNAPLWEGRPPDARVALVWDYESFWALQADSMGTQMDYREQFESFYAILRRRGFAVDALPPDAGLSARYGLVVAPMPVIGRAKAAKRWRNYADAGGRLLVTAPAGYRTQQNAWLMEAAPGPLSETLGLRVKEYDVPRPDGDTSLEMDGELYPVRNFISLLELEGAAPLAHYAGGPYGEAAALTRNVVGQGAAYFLGAVSAPEMYERLLAAALDDAGLCAHDWADRLVEVIPLESAEGSPSCLFVLNHSPDERKLALPEGESCKDLLTGAEHRGAFTLEGYGVALIER